MSSNGARYQFKDLELESLLLVEGINDARFFDAFLSALDITDVQIAQVGGKPKFRPFLNHTLRSSRNFSRLRRLGIVRDADDNPDAALQSLCDALDAARLPRPSTHERNFPVGDLKVSIAILPDSSSTGNLEDLCLRSLSGNPEVMCIDSYVDCITQNTMEIASKDLAVAKVNTYLAVGPIPDYACNTSPDSIQRSNPGLRLGEAAEKGVWDWHSSTFSQLAKFLLTLYSN